MVNLASPVLCLILWCHLTGAVLQSSENGRQERSLLNQAGTCLEQSEITENTIIRTKDSRALGARFLNETSLGLNSRDQCLRLCCSFHGCNVAVYEEKVNLRFTEFIGSLLITNQPQFLFIVASNSV